MDSFLPTPIRSDSIRPTASRVTPPKPGTDDFGFGVEFARHVRDDRRTSRPPSVSREGQTPDERLAPREDERRNRIDDEKDIEGRRSKPDASASNEARSDEARLDGAREAVSLERQRALAQAADEVDPAKAAGLTLNATGFAAPTAPTGAPPASEAAAEGARDPQLVTAAAGRVTEEQLNIRKLTRYLADQTARGADQKTEADRSDPKPHTPTLSEGEGEGPSPAEGSDAQPTSDRRTQPLDFGAQSKADPRAPVPGQTSENLELSRPFDPSTRFGATAATEPDANTMRQQQLRAAAQRAMAEARQKLLEPGRLQDGRLAVTLDVREASIPLRLRFSPDGRGGQNVAFLVSTAKDLRELKRLMPEIETALTELPVELSDVQVNIDSNRDGGLARAARGRP